MTYKILLKKVLDGHCPEVAFLDDYDEVGSVISDSRTKATRYVDLYVVYGMKEALNRDSSFNLDKIPYSTYRLFEPGDILVDEDLVATVLTPTYKWSTVTLR